MSCITQGKTLSWVTSVLFIWLFPVMYGRVLFCCIIQFIYNYKCVLFIIKNYCHVPLVSLPTKNNFTETQLRIQLTHDFYSSEFYGCISSGFFHQVKQVFFLQITVCKICDIKLQSSHVLFGWCNRLYNVWEQVEIIATIEIVQCVDKLHLHVFFGWCNRLQCVGAS